MYNKFRIYSILLSASLLLFSCGAKEKKTFSIEEEDIVEEQVDSLQIQVEEDETDVDEIEEYPNLSELKKIPLLFSGNLFIGGEGYNNEMGWIGLFKDRDKTYLDGTTLYFDQDEDHILVEVSSVHSDEAIIFFSGLPFEKGEVKSVKLPKDKREQNRISIGSKYRFTFNDIEYTLLAEGYQSKQSEDVVVYQLFLEAKDGQVVKKDPLYINSRFASTMGDACDIFFIGDLDRDGKPDFIIDTSGNYSSSIPTVYLSSKADADHLVKPIGYALFTD